MLKLFDLSYRDMTTSQSHELYSLRKQSFKDRLNWEVNCTDGKEFDEFDNDNTRYILGIYNDQLICSVRFIETHLPNMITHTFHSSFYDIHLPDECFIESSRFFVDKTRAKQTLGIHYPISYLLFLSMINYTRYHNYNGIYTIVSSSMLKILKRSGWNAEVIKMSYLNENEKIYLVTLPTNRESQLLMAEKVRNGFSYFSLELFTWPLFLHVTLLEV